MATKHKLVATIPCGDPDLGAEVECEIAFNFTRGRNAVIYLRNGDPGYPADPDEIEFIDAARLCNGKPAPFDGAFADLETAWLNDLADAWLETEEGVAEAMATVDADYDEAREFAAELRADR
jgi:hypothetical protein